MELSSWPRVAKIDVLNGEGMKQDEMKLHQKSIDIFEIYKLLQRMKNK